MNKWLSYEESIVDKTRMILIKEFSFIKWYYI